MAELEAAVLEPVELETPATETDPALESPETPVTDPAELPEVKGDERVMPKWLLNMKATDPEGFRDAKEKFFALRDQDAKLKDFDLDGTKSFLEEHGGLESLNTVLGELRSKAEELDKINAAITNGDTSVLQSIPAESLAKLAPSVMSQWAQSAPEEYNAAVYGALAHVVNQTMTQSLYGDEKISVPMLLAEARSALQYAPAEQQGQIAQAVMARFQQFLGGIQQQATAKPVANKPAAETKGPSVQQERQQWEQEKFDSSLRTDVETFRTFEVEKSLSAYIARRPKDADAKELAISNVREQVIKRLAQDQDFQNKLNGLTVRRDKDGAMRLIKSRESKAIEEIAPKVGRTIFGQLPSTPVTPKAAPAPVKRVPVPATDKTASIFQRIASR